MTDPRFAPLPVLGIAAALLLAAAGCGDSFLEQQLGELRVSATTTGGDLDLDGYEVAVGAELRQPVAVNGAEIVLRLPAGTVPVQLGDVAANCTVSGANPRTAVVPRNETARVAFAVTCVATGVEVTIITTGIDVDPDGYAVSVDGASPLAVPVNGSVAITRLSAGTHTVTLSGIAGNCSVSGANPRSADVPAGEIVGVGFSLTCVAATATIAVTAATSGPDPDPNGYTVQVDAGQPRFLSVAGTVFFEGLAAGDHNVTLAGAAANCTIAGQNPRALAVTTGGVTRDTARTTFEVTCVAVTGVVEITAATSGVDFDQNGYMVQLDGGTFQPLSVNGTVRFTGVSAGDHQVALADVAANCPVTGENPRTVSVTTGTLTRDTARTTFEVACEPRTGTARIITSTTGADFDPNGYFMGVDCDPYYGCYYAYYTEQMSVNDTVTLSGVPSGPHTFQVDDVAVNCSVGGANPRSVHVAGGTTTEIVFAVTCAALGSIQVTTTTTGVAFDVNGYRIAADGPRLDATRDVPVNGNATISGLLPDDYSVSLAGVSLNCDVTSPNPVVVTVPSGGTATVGFSAVCAAATELAFTMATSAGYEIHTIGSNGGGLTQLTSNTAYEDAPAWSPDGSKIAFQSDRDGNAEIYVMNADGTGQTRLTNHAAPDYAPTWSAGGTRIAFVSERDGNAEVYVMNVDGTGVQRLTTHSGYDNNPAWSPDGSKIAFSSTRDVPAGAIYVMDPSGAAVTRLSTGGLGGDDAPAWSPDGAAIAFQRVVACEYYYCQRDLYVMNAADGSGVRELTSGPDDHADPAWSPDGLWIAFNAAPCSYYGCSPWSIKAVRNNGTDVRDVTGADAFHPAWRP